MAMKGNTGLRDHSAENMGSSMPVLVIVRRRLSEGWDSSMLGGDIKVYCWFSHRPGSDLNIPPELISKSNSGFDVKCGWDLSLLANSAMNISSCQ